MPITMGQLAQQLGVSIATVSLALRGKGRMAKATRLRIREAARASDYHVHPVISKACSLARRSSLANYRETLAFITEYPMDPARYYEQRLYQGAAASAAEMGYKLEPFLASGRRADQKRMSRMLSARGIRGLIIMPRLSETHPRLQLDWENFASVEIFRTIWHPSNFHHVGTADYSKFTEAMHLLKKVGYRRIGFAIEPSQDHHQRGICHAAYLKIQSKLPPAERIPPLVTFGRWSEATLKRWIKRYEPDVLFIHENPEMREWLKQLHLRAPQDISIFCQNVQSPELSGLRRDYTGIGQSAVEMVSLLLGNNALGLVGNPRCWLVDEYWQVGESLSRSIASYISKDGYLVKNIFANSGM